MFELSSMALQVSLVAFSAALLIGSAGLILASKKIQKKGYGDKESVICFETSSTLDSIPLPFYSGAISSKQRPATSSSSQQLQLPTNQQVIALLKRKRCSLPSPELHSTRKFALVNAHIKNICKDHRLFVQAPQYSTPL